MSDCLITGSIDINCSDQRQVGGVKTRAWRVDSLSGFSYTTDVDGYVTSLSFGTYGGLYRLVGPKNSHSGGVTPQVNEGGSRYFLHNVTVRSLNTTPAEDAILAEWLASESPVILETNNREFFLYGGDNGMTATAEGGSNTGTDFTGTELAFGYTLQGAETALPLRIKDTDYATTLALLEGYELD
jgi:hypothetical protein